MADYFATNTQSVDPELKKKAMLTKAQEEAAFRRKMDLARKHYTGGGSIDITTGDTTQSMPGGQVPIQTTQQETQTVVSGRQKKGYGKLQKEVNAQLTEAQRIQEAATQVGLKKAELQKQHASAVGEILDAEASLAKDYRRNLDDMRYQFEIMRRKEEDATQALMKDPKLSTPQQIWNNAPVAQRILFGVDAFMRGWNASTGKANVTPDAFSQYVQNQMQNEIGSYKAANESKRKALEASGNLFAKYTKHFATEKEAIGAYQGLISDLLKDKAEQMKASGVPLDTIVATLKASQDAKKEYIKTKLDVFKEAPETQFQKTTTVKPYLGHEGKLPATKVPDKLIDEFKSAAKVKRGLAELYSFIRGVQGRASAAKKYGKKFILRDSDVGEAVAKFKLMRRSLAKSYNSGALSDRDVADIQTIPIPDRAMLESIITGENTGTLQRYQKRLDEIDQNMKDTMKVYSPKYDLTPWKPIVGTFMIDANKIKYTPGSNLPELRK